MNNLLNNLQDNTYYNIVSALIKEGELLKKDLPYVYNLFIDKRFSDFHTLKTELLFSIRKYRKLYNKKLFELIFGKNLQILEVDPVRVYFPVIKDKKAYLSEAYIFILDNPTQLLTFPNTQEEIVENLKKIKLIVKKDFFVAFRSIPFSGSSFMLSIISAFFVKKEIIENFIFSGTVDENCKIERLKYLKIKKSLSKKYDKFFISAEQLKNISEIKYLNSETINLPFVQLFGKNINELRKNFEFLKSQLNETDKVWLKILDLKEKDLSIFSENFIKNDLKKWDSLLSQFYRKIKNLYSIHFKKINIHFLCSLSAFAFGMGVILGAKRKLSIYHFQDGSIFKVYDFINNSPRAIKEKVKDFSIIEYRKILNNSDEAGIIIYLASHNPGKLAQDFICNDLKANFIEISLKEKQGNIPVKNSNLWINIVREIYTLINNIEEILQNKIKKFHLILSIPVPIAFCLGMCLGDYKNLNVYNYEKVKNCYTLVLSSEKTKFFKNFF